jgi:hypothetical protein
MILHPTQLIERGGWCKKVFKNLTFQGALGKFLLIKFLQARNFFQWIKKKY